MLTIRFNRTGKKNRAHFRIVLQERAVAPGGRHVEILGSWDPHIKKGVFKDEKIKYWIGKGAQISDSVYNLLIKQGIIEGKKRAVKTKKAIPVKEQKTEIAEIKKEEAKTEERKPEATEVKKEEIKPEEAKTEKPKKEEVKEAAKTEEVKTEKSKTEEKKEQNLT